MKLFVSSLSGSLQSQKIDNPFSQKIEIIHNNEDAYSHIEMVDDRIYILYMTSTGHDVYDGVINMVYSDDDGETWTSDGAIYDGQHVLVDNPQYLIDDPLALVDCRDSIMQVSGDGNYMLMLVPVAVGHQAPARDTLITRSVCVKIPIVNGALDYANQTNHYVGDNIFVCCGLFNLNGVTYTNGNNKYHSGGSANEFYKSLDYGETWTLVSTLFQNLNPVGGSEVSINYINGGLIAMARTLDGTTRRLFARSNDMGVTWTDYYNVEEWSIDAMHILDVGNGKFVSIGREKSLTTENKLSMLAIFNESDYSYVANSILYTTTPTNYFDKGYGSIVKHKDKYFITWSRSGGNIWFRQLNYNTDTELFEYGND